MVKGKETFPEKRFGTVKTVPYSFHIVGAAIGRPHRKNPPTKRLVDFSVSFYRCSRASEISRRARSLSGTSVRLEAKQMTKGFSP